MRDVDDGLLFRAHPGLGREGAINARDENGTQHQVMKLCFIAYLDGIEAANPLGVARGSHSMEYVYVALLNPPNSMRYKMEYLFPVTSCHSSTLKRYGTCAVIGGRGGGDDDPDQPLSLSAVMRKLNPASHSDSPPWKRRGAVCAVAGSCSSWRTSEPLGRSCRPRTAESVAAAMPCSGPGGSKDDVFEDGASFQPCFGGKPCWELRSMEHFRLACLLAARCQSQRGRDAALKVVGHQQDSFCLDPDDFLLFEPFTAGLPQDVMHTLYCKLPPPPSTASV